MNLYPLVTEYYPNGNLWNYITKNGDRISRSRLCRIIKGAASGISHLHLENVVHRDIAARNGTIEFVSLGLRHSFIEFSFRSQSVR